MRRATLLAFCLAVAACSSGETPAGPGPFPEDALAVRASSDIAVGTDRLLVGVSQADGSRLGSPDDEVAFEIAPVEDPQDVRRFPADFVWIVPDQIGIYRATIETDRPGPWTVDVVPEGGGAVTPTVFEVRAEPLTPAVGSRAVAVRTPTVEDRPIEELTTDPDPDPSFYETSLDEAMASGRPTVVVFATPAFCQTASCGPMLDITKEVATAHPEVDFIHVEVYEGFGEEGFAPDAAHLSPAVLAWSLPSEPWVFVIGADGTITHKFEGVIDPSELEEALP